MEWLSVGILDKEDNETVYITETGMVYHRIIIAIIWNYLFEQSMQKRWVTCVTMIRKNIIHATNVCMEVQLRRYI